MVEPAVATWRILSPLRSRAAEVLGLMTYSAYLYHNPIFVALDVEHSYARQSFYALFAIFTLSLVTYVLWEQQWIALGRWLTSPGGEAESPSIALPSPAV